MRSCGDGICGFRVRVKGAKRLVLSSPPDVTTCCAAPRLPSCVAAAVVSDLARGSPLRRKGGRVLRSSTLLASRGAVAVVLELRGCVCHVIATGKR